MNLTTLRLRDLLVLYDDSLRRKLLLFTWLCTQTVIISSLTLRRVPVGGCLTHAGRILMSRCDALTLSSSEHTDFYTFL